MDSFVVGFVLFFALAHCSGVFLEICLRKEDAGAVGAFEVADIAVLLLSHGVYLSGCICRFFCRRVRIHASLLLRQLI
jgi:hypothetical protein